jgi:hypothetical protein
MLGRNVAEYFLFFREFRMSENLKSFINNRDVEKGKKATFYRQLFSKSLWLPRALKAPLELSDDAQKVTSKTIKQHIEKDNFIISETDYKAKHGPVVKEARPLEPKPKIEIESKKIPVQSYEGDFQAELFKINSDWKLDQMSGFSSFKGSIDIVFYGLDDIDPEDAPEIVPFSLIESSQDLLGKMIGAMNLKMGQFVRFPRFKGESGHQLFTLGMEYFKPKYIVSLGATATNDALFSGVHGQVHKVVTEVNGNKIEMSIFPLFHPQLLEINQSMKRTAWIDMKKLMEVL